jgi:dTDP-4-dehydrorhamnose 3,5-epimerase-like enzyme
VRIDGQETEFTAPHMIYINKDKVHELQALSDNTIAYCIHALRDKETGDILDPSMVPKGSILQALQASEPLVASGFD